jgi:hypothetical protein
VGATTHDLSSAEAIPGYLKAIGVRADRLAALTDLLTAAVSNARDEVGQLIKVLTEAEAGRRTLNRVVFSGHSVGRQRVRVGERRLRCARLRGPRTGFQVRRSAPAVSGCSDNWDDGPGRV